MYQEPRRIVNPDTTGLNSFLTKMYGFMAAAVAVSAITAYLIATTYYHQVMGYFSIHHGMIWLLFIIQFGIAFLFRANQSPAICFIGLFAFAILEGLFFSSFFSVYTAQNITMAFVSAAILFVVLIIMGLTTKRDLARAGHQASAALIALIVVMLINMFLHSSLIVYIFSFIGVIIFSVLTMYDTQRFLRLYNNYDDGINTTSLALVGAFTLYLDFINIFLDLLTIFGSDNNNN